MPEHVLTMTVPRRGSTNREGKFVRSVGWEFKDPKDVFTSIVLAELISAMSAGKNYSILFMERIIAGSEIMELPLGPCVDQIESSFSSISGMIKVLQFVLVIREILLVYFEPLSFNYFLLIIADTWAFGSFLVYPCPRLGYSATRIHRELMAQVNQMVINTMAVHSNDMT